MAFCENCGQQVSEQAAACPNCGHPIARAPAAYVGGVKRTEGTAIASLVLGIAGFVVCPLILHILAIVFGNQAKRKIQANPSLEGESMAKAGVILGWIGLGITAIVGIIIIAALASGNDFNALGMR